MSIRNMLGGIFAFVVIVGMSSFVFSDTIILKSGRKIEGRVIDKTDKYIKIDVCGVIVTYLIEEVELIKKEEISSHEAESLSKLSKSKSFSVINKLIKALDSLESMHVEGSLDVVITGLVDSFKVDSFANINFKEKLFMHRTKVRSYKLSDVDLDYAIGKMIQQKIAEARRKGASEKQIALYRKMMEEKLTEAKFQAAERLKLQAKGDLLCVFNNDGYYCSMFNKWFRIDNPSLKRIWLLWPPQADFYEMYPTMEDKEAANNFVGVFYPLYLIAANKDRLYVEEGEFKNKECYIVNVDKEILSVDMLRKIPLGGAMSFANFF